MKKRHLNVQIASIAVLLAIIIFAIVSHKNDSIITTAEEQNITTEKTTVATQEITKKTTAKTMAKTTKKTTKKTTATTTTKPKPTTTTTNTKEEMTLTITETTQTTDSIETIDTTINNITTIISETFITEQEEIDNTEETKVLVNLPDDCLVIGDSIIPIVYAPATQENVDMYNVIRDTGEWSTETDKYFFGHNTRSLGCLFNVNNGDIITLREYGVETKYEVFICELGILTEDQRNIKSANGDIYFVNSDFGCETIRMITCYSVFGPPNYRLVVIGRKLY